jgi:molecular chaperone GrpE
MNENENNEEQVSTPSFDEEKYKDFIAKMKVKMQELQEENNALKELVSNKEKESNDKLMRAYADSENLRKRLEKQIDEARNYSVTNFAKELTPVMDDLFRALQFIPADISQDMKNIVYGVEMTKDRMIDVFKKFNIERIEPVSGDIFDYNLHQALSHVPSGERKAGEIVEVVQAGYRILDRVIKPALVTVSNSEAK